MKYVLCRPRGGFHDTLCEIGRCHQYAEKTGRKLIVDSLNSGLHDALWKYFLPTSDVYFDNKYPDFNKLSAYPKSVEGRIDSYVAHYEPGAQNYTDETFNLLRIDEKRDYEEELLVHEQCWYGYSMAVHALESIKFRPRIAKEILKRLSPLSFFDAVHVRNTDYQTDYKQYFRNIYNSLCGRRVLICSDDYQVYQFARIFFDQSRVFRLSRFEDNNGKPLHAEKSDNQFETNMQMFTDLVALTMAENLYILPINGGSGISGFSTLAAVLREKSLMKRMLFSDIPSVV